MIAPALIARRRQNLAVPPSNVLYLSAKAFKVQRPANAYSMLADANSDEVRFLLNSGDVYPGDLADRSRVEVERNANFLWGVVNVVSFDWMLEPGDPFASTHAYCKFQAHASEDVGDAGVSPIVAFNIQNDVSRLVTRSSLQDPMVNDPPSVTRDTHVVQRGRWYNDELHMKFDPAAGYLKYLRDGVVRFEGNIPLGYVDVLPPYGKAGLYLRPATHPTIGLRIRNWSFP